MIVYKFGGASVKDAEGVRNIGKIVSRITDEMIVVVSAMGKTTNAMEEIARAYFDGEKSACLQKADEVIERHLDVANELFIPGSECHLLLGKWFGKLRSKLEEPPSLNFDFEYDQIVFYGEMFSTTIVSCYLKSSGTDNRWLDIRQVLKTNEQYREAETDWDLSAELMKKNIDFSRSRVHVTQGFIGGTINNLTTTLGREGSDYTSAVLGYVFDAGHVAIWKDVPGILNADPRWYSDTEKIDEISYREAIELAFYGAQVIHPKTIKPLENKRIPLLVKSFLAPEAAGTKIYKIDGHVELPPVYILKKEQVLLTISPKDFSFIVENNLSEIFKIFSKWRVKVNMMHNSAINFSVCMDYVNTLEELLLELNKKYVVKYNDDLELVTIRHYTDVAVRKVLEGKEIIDSQVSRKTARYVVRKSDWKFIK